MRILLLGLNYAPELVGIGLYTSEMAVYLADAGHEVEVIAAKPYYPAWSTWPEYRGGLYRRTRERGVDVIRCPIYVPRRPTGIRRIVHHLSFAAAALPPIARALAARSRPDLLFAVAPSLMSVPLAARMARLRGVKTWLHIQDFEVGAARATGLLGGGRLARAADRFESFAFAGFDRYSTISPQMCARLAAGGVVPERIFELRNWADTSAITPLAGTSRFRERWGIATPHVALYSGNIANKQGLEIIVAAARALRDRDDLTFLICGEGPTRDELMASAADLPNIRFEPLQPADQLGELLGLATIHLLPQRESAADLVLPSKLTNMLASGRPVVATAAAATGLAAEIEGCGIATPPGDAAAFAAAIATLLDDPAGRADMGATARRRAEERWSRAAILGGLDRELRRLAGGA